MILIELMETEQRTPTKYTLSQRIAQADTGERRKRKGKKEDEGKKKEEEEEKRK